MTRDLQTILCELRKQLQDLYGDRLVALILYGSQARGDPTPDSDIDVLVVLRGHVDSGEEIERTGWGVSDLSLNCDRVISLVFMDEERYRTRNGPFLRNVRREGMPQ